MSAGERFRLYPRGFIGGAIPPTVVPKQKHTQGEQIQSFIMNLHNAADNSVAPNAGIESLYGQYLRGNLASEMHEFRERVFIAALNAFGTKNFFDWYVIQTEAASTGSIHTDFLEDTLKFISTGKRDMCLENWQALIKMGANNGNSGMSPKAKEFFGILNDRPLSDFAKTNDEAFELARLESIIQRWCSVPGGFEDLLISLHILFGDV